METSIFPFSLWWVFGYFFLGSLFYFTLLSLVVFGSHIPEIEATEPNNTWEEMCSLNAWERRGTPIWVVSVESVSRSIVFYSSRPQRLQPTRLLNSWNSPSKNTGVGSHSLLQGIFLTQGVNPGLPHCRQIHHLSHQGSPKNTGMGRHGLPIPGINPRSPSLQADSLPFKPPGKPPKLGLKVLRLW